MDTLALTDRDGAYGVVKFAKACAAAGVRPVFGVDLAVAPVARPVRRASPAGARAGAAPPAEQPRPGRGVPRPDPDRGVAALPRVVLLARDGRGWAALCRLVSATHLAGERGAPVSTPRPRRRARRRRRAGRLARRAARPGVRARPGGGRPARRPRPRPPRPLARRPRRATASSSRSSATAVPATSAGPPGCSGFAAEQRARAVLTNVVRYADRGRRPDRRRPRRRPPARRPRPAPRRPAQRRGRAAVRQGDGGGRRRRSPAPPGCGDEGRGLLARTRVEADRCAVDPRARPRHRRGPLPRARGRRRRAAWRCCASAARPASAGAALARDAGALEPARGRARRHPAAWATRRTSSPSPTSSTSSRAWACASRRGGAAPASW